MPNSRAIKQRIKSARNISKITKAMEMVSASKMRKSQDQAAAAKPYSNSLNDILKKISLYTDSSLHPLLNQNNHGDTYLIMVATDRGLVGGLNANLYRNAAKFLNENPDTKIISIGKKARLFAQKSGAKLIADFSNLRDKISYSLITPISELVINSFLKHEASRVFLLFTQSKNTITSQPRLIQLLPMMQDFDDNPAELLQVEKEYVFEPSANEILNWLLPYYIENQIFFALLQAKASEHSARMISMKNASDNAKQIVSQLSLDYNRSRQAAITSELQEITTAQLAI